MIGAVDFDLALFEKPNGGYAVAIKAMSAIFATANQSGLTKGQFDAVVKRLKQVDDILASTLQLLVHRISVTFWGSAMLREPSGYIFDHSGEFLVFDRFS